MTYTKSLVKTKRKKIHSLLNSCCLVFYSYGLGKIILIGNPSYTNARTHTHTLHLSSASTKRFVFFQFYIFLLFPPVDFTTAAYEVLNHLHFCMAALKIRWFQLKFMLLIFYSTNWTTAVMQTWSVRSMAFSAPRQSGQLLFQTTVWGEKLSSYFLQFGPVTLSHQCMCIIDTFYSFPACSFTQRREETKQH